MQFSSERQMCKESSPEAQQPDRVPLLDRLVKVRSPRLFPFYLHAARSFAIVP